MTPTHKHIPLEGHAPCPASPPPLSPSTCLLCILLTQVICDVDKQFKHSGFGSQHITPSYSECSFSCCLSPSEDEQWSKFIPIANPATNVPSWCRVFPAFSPIPFWTVFESSLSPWSKSPVVACLSKKLISCCRADVRYRCRILAVCRKPASSMASQSFSLDSSRSL